MNTRDVFFWDPSHLFAPALHALLEPRTNGLFVWHEISGRFADPMDPNDPSLGMARLNFASTATTWAFAADYADTRLPGRCAQGHSVEYGQTFPDWTGLPIRIDNQHIHDCAAANLLNYPEDVLRAVVVAHETGHSLSRPHPVRAACCTLDNNIDPRQKKQRSQISLNEWAWNPDNHAEIYVRYTTYSYALMNQTETADNLDTSIDYPVTTNVLSGNGVASQQLMSTQGTDQIFRVMLSVVPAAGNILIDDLTQTIMDWTPDLNIRALDTWNFLQDDINNFKPKP